MEVGNAKVSKLDETELIICLVLAVIPVLEPQQIRGFNVGMDAVVWIRRVGLVGFLWVNVVHDAEGVSDPKTLARYPFHKAFVSVLRAVLFPKDI